MPVSLTDMDEENIILALFAKTKGVDKIVAKVNEDGRAQLVEELGIDLIVSAKTATADAIMSYVRARQNSLKNVNVESYVSAGWRKSRSTGIYYQRKNRIYRYPV